jgi:hypothetical protein
MVALGRESNVPYRAATFLTPLETVARVERLLPPEWIHPDGNDVMPALAEYAAPLIGEIAEWAHL